MTRAGGRSGRAPPRRREPDCATRAGGVRLGCRTEIADAPSMADRCSPLHQSITMIELLTFLAFIAYCAFLPTAVAIALQHPRAQRVLQLHGHWVVPAVWVAGIVLFATMLGQDHQHLSAPVRALAYAACMLGPILIGPVTLAARDARRAGVQSGA